MYEIGFIYQGLSIVYIEFQRKGTHLVLRMFPHHPQQKKDPILHTLA